MTRAGAIRPRLQRSQRQWRCFVCDKPAPEWALVLGSDSRYIVLHKDCAVKGFEELSRHQEAWHAWSGKEGDHADHDQ